MTGLATLPTRTAGSLGTMKFDAEPIAEDKVDQHILAAEHNVAMEALEGVCEEMGEHENPAPGSVLWRLPLVERIAVGGGYTWQSYAETGDLAAHAYWRIAPDAPATMTLPALPSGSEVHVRHLAIEASAHAVTLARHGGTGTINGSAASLTITARSETTLYSVVSTSSGHVIVPITQQAESNVLWEWNGTDLSQFDSPEGDTGLSWDVTNFGAYPSTGTYWDPDAGTKKCIRATTSNVAPRVNGLPIKTSGIAGGLPTRFIIEARVACQNANTVAILVPYWENYQHYCGVYVNYAGNTVSALRDNAAYVDGAVIHSREANLIFGSHRRVAGYVEHANGSTKPRFAVAMPARDDEVFPWHEPRAQSAFNASWLGLTHNPRIAIGVRAWNNAAGHIAFSDVRILRAD